MTGLDLEEAVECLEAYAEELGDCRIGNALRVVGTELARLEEALEATEINLDYANEEIKSLRENGHCSAPDCPSAARAFKIEEEIVRLRHWAAGLSVTHPHLVPSDILTGVKG